MNPALVAFCGTATIVALSCTAGSAAAQQNAEAQNASSDRARGVGALTIVGLATMQPVDQTYVSDVAPYLNRGLGGFGPGAAAGLTLFTDTGISAAVEVSTATVSAVQHGRLVGGTAQGRFRETLVSALVGAAPRSRRILLLAGVSRLIGTPTLNGIAVTDPDAAHVAFTAGVDTAWPLGRRAAVVAQGRYSVTARSDAAAQIGVGNQIIRAGMGLRILLE